MSDIPGVNSKRARSLFDALATYTSPATLETRGENAWGVAVKFMSLLEEQIESEDERKKLMSAWYKSVRDNDFRKFRRALNRYRKSLDLDDTEGS